MPRGTLLQSRTLANPGSPLLPSSVELGVTASGDTTGATDRAALNTALAAVIAAGTGRVKGIPGKTYYVDGTPLQPGSGCVLDMTGCTIQKATGATGNLLANKACTPVATDAAASITALGNVLTTTLPGVIGQTVIVAGADGTAGAPGALVANVTAVGSGTLTLSKAAVNTVTGKASLHTRDTDVTIIGGNWVRGNNTASAAPYATPAAGNVGLYNVLLRHVDRLTIRDMRQSNGTAASYCLALGDVSDFVVDRYRITSSFSDGIHLNGPAVNGVIARVSGVTTDDVVALTCRDYADAEDVCGDITDVEVRSTHHLPGASGRVLAIAGAGMNLLRITFDGIYGTTTNSPFVMLDDVGSPNTQGGAYDAITVKSMKAITTATSAVIQLKATGVRNIRFEGVSVNYTATLTSLFAMAGCNIENLTVSHLAIESLPANCAIFGLSTGRVDRLKLTDYRISFNNGGQSIITGSGTAVITYGVELENGHIDDSAGAQVAYFPTAGATCPAIHISNLIADGLGWLADLNTATNIHAANVRLTNLRSGQLNLRASANVGLYCANYTTNRITIVKTTGYLLFVHGTAARCDISLINNANDGDHCINTNTGLSCGAGAVIYSAAGTGNKWKHIYSGATY